ncbi:MULTISPECIES: hypothetical protein [unclassified Curtobacterium]|uniref:hypothetical protein n=1 Tax=unclassified Curtobacterium TaxID=257496 RepID=UPI00226B6514|nr:MULTISPECIES: hypothetical protein [unclassified Curtobacterium]
MALVIGLTGCATNTHLPSDPEERILLFKAQAQAAESAVARLIRTAARGEVKQIPEGTVLACSGGRQWSGNTRITLTDPTSGPSVLRDLSSDAAEHGFSVARSTTADGVPRIRLVDDNGTTLLATVWVDGKSIDVDSFSKCFPLPADFIPHGSY